MVKFKGDTMKKLNSTRIHLDIAKNRPFSEDCVKRFNSSLRGFTHGWSYVERRMKQFFESVRLRRAKR